MNRSASGRDLSVVNCTEDSRWRNRAEVVTGREEIAAFLTSKWARELDYRLIKGLWSWSGNRIAVRFAYEWHDDSGHWFRSYGSENWEFDTEGLMRRRFASINDLPIDESERKFRWPLGRRPDDHPSLSALGLQIGASLSSWASSLCLRPSRTGLSGRPNQAYRNPSTWAGSHSTSGG